MSNTEKNSFSELQNKLAIVVDEYNKASNPLHDALRVIEEVQKTNLVKIAAASLTNNSAYENFRRTISQLTLTALSAYTPNLTTAISAASHAFLGFRETLKRITFTTISEERKQKLLLAYQKWGEYGWTTIPIASDSLFNNAPSSRKEANRLALKECSNKAMKKLFDLTLGMRYCKKTDYIEAIHNFENRNYTSCALLLFALIDAKLIRLQKRSDLKGKRRGTGLSAVDNAKSRADTGAEEHMLLTMLFHENLFACLEKVFEGGKDFKAQPEIINRNFLAHGMLTRKVSRMECVQLFLLYYNVLDLLECIYL